MGLFHLEQRLQNVEDTMATKQQVFEAIATEKAEVAARLAALAEQIAALQASSTTPAELDTMVNAVRGIYSEA